MDQGIYDAHQDIAGLVNLGMEFFRVRDGMPGTGVGNPTADQAGFAAARVAAMAAPYGGIVYVDPGAYSVTGDFDCPLKVQLRGAGSSSVVITNTGNKPFISALDNAVGGGIQKRRHFEGFRLLGNGGAAAKGILRAYPREHGPRPFAGDQRTVYLRPRPRSKKRTKYRTTAAKPIK